MIERIRIGRDFWWNGEEYGRKKWQTKSKVHTAPRRKYMMPS